MNLLIQGNSLNIPLADRSANCCVTSPPYYGLRDYNVEGQIGLEQTPDEYVAKLVDVFREVKRVLRDDGTLWLNLGDSYLGGKGKSGSIGDKLQEVRHANGKSLNRGYQCATGGEGETKITDGRHLLKLGFKPKDLLGIPWRVAFALQTDGWYLRSDIIWHKPNPMPESVKDRPTKAHEYIFLLSKNARYYYDSESIKENGVYPKGTKGAKGSAERSSTDKVNSRPPEYKIYDGKRNKRDVWTVTTKPYKGAHYATFPPDLIEPCILAGCPDGGIVLDPFVGSGTTVMVANRNNRKGIGLDLSWKYLIDNAKVRIENMK